MRKSIFKVLLFGAILLTGSFITSCGNDNDDLNSRITVVEGMIKELQEAIANAQVTGSTITEATQDPATGVWTLVLSNGTTVKITPSTGGGGGGGSTITVVDNPDNMIITIDGTEYVIPKGTASVQLIYSPQYEDGIEMMDATGVVNVQFMVSPGITDADLAAATFDIQEAHALQTRASDLFKVTGTPVSANGFVTVPVKGIGCAAGSSYAISVVMNLNGKQFISNYFTMKVASDFVFVPEDLVTPVFKSVITDGVESSTNPGFYTATLPNGLVEDFNLNDYLDLSDPALKDAMFVIAPQDAQNADGANQYALLTSSLNSTTGAFALTGRPGTAFNPNTPNVPNGILIYVVTNDQIRMKIFWQIFDPLANVDFISSMSVGIYAQHMEILGAKDDGSDLYPAGAGTIDVPALFSKASEADTGDAAHNPVFPNIYDNAGKWLTTVWPNYSVTLVANGDVIKYDGTRYVMGAEGTKYAKFSRGIYWHSDQLSIASSNRRNDPTIGTFTTDADRIAYCGGVANGEIIGGWDGIPGEDRVAYGIDMNDAGQIVTTDKYQGWAFRAGVWANYEYIYGNKGIGGDALAFVWVNRRSCPTGPIQDPAAR